MKVKCKYYESLPGKRNESKKMVDVQVEVCSFLKRSRVADVFTGMFLGIIKKNGKIFTKCPVPVGSYYAYNMTLNGIELPAIAKHQLGSKDVKLTFEIDVKGTDKKWYKMGNLTFWGGYKNI